MDFQLKEKNILEKKLEEQAEKMELRLEEYSI